MRKLICNMYRYFFAPKSFINCNGDTRSYKVVITQKTLERIVDLYHEFPNVENGGRLLGFYGNDGKTIYVKEVLPPGPNARRTKSSLFQDGIWQTWIFKKIERQFQDIHFVGSYHHHVCNGLPVLSTGDISGYRKLLCDARSDLPFVAALLISDIRAVDFADDEQLKNKIHFSIITQEDVVKVDQLFIDNDLDSELSDLVDKYRHYILPWFQLSENKNFLSVMQNQCSKIGLTHITMSNDDILTYHTSCGSFILEPDKRNRVFYLPPVGIPLADNTLLSMCECEGKYVFEKGAFEEIISLLEGTLNVDNNAQS